MYVTAKNVIKEAFAAGEVLHAFALEGAKKREVVELVRFAQKHGITVTRLSKSALKERTGKSAPFVAEVKEGTRANVFDVQGLIAKSANEGATPLILMLDGITDVHNFGAILRSAHYFGVTGVIVGKDNAAPMNDVVHKTSAGASYHIPVVRVVNLGSAVEELKEGGFWSYAADGDGDTLLSDATFDTPSLLIMGNEHAGVRSSLLKKADFRLAIPRFTGFDSLNVSTATAVLLYGWRAGTTRGTFNN